MVEILCEIMRFSVEKFDEKLMGKEKIKHYV